MEPLIRVKADTPLRDILDAYPWLPEELIRLEPRFRIIRSPLMQVLIRRSTVADAAKKVGQPVEKLLDRFEQIIREHEE